MKNNNLLKKIVITGPESTGKTTLSEQLSANYNTIYFHEYAREYIENLNRKYKFNDIVSIAKKQIETLSYKKYENAKKIVFFDTGLIITKIWFQKLYNKVPDFLEEAISSINIDLFLLCYPDIEWVPDKLRENGGKKRFELFNEYKYELKKNNFKYFIIKGDDNARFLSAKEKIDSAYCL